VYFEEYMLSKENKRRYQLKVSKLVLIIRALLEGLGGVVFD
jgi:hypothetical protein